MMISKARFGSLTALAVAALALSGCAALNQPEMFEKTFWEGGSAKENALAELGLAELAKGNQVEAEHFFQQALKKDEKDVYALTGLGILYQNTGQHTKARSMYETVLALRPDREEQMVFWSSAQTRPLIEVAGYNLALIDNTAPANGVASSATGGPALKSAPTASVSIARPANGGSEVSGPGSMLSKADANIGTRFRILASLRDQGLLTQQEYAQRRQANVGALLPLTSPPPAVSLDRPVPSAEQISGRLQAIGRSLEMRAMTVAQHSSERNMILDALMPSAPVAVANPGAPPQGLMEAADAVRRIEQIKADGLISSDEYAKERAAIERAVQPAKAAGTASSAGPAVEAQGLATPAEGGSRPAVHLASFRSPREAEQGWAGLKRKHGDLLGSLKAETPRVDLGPGKGVFYRLKAGPLASKEAARDLCRKLEAMRQYCEPTVF